MSSTNQLIINNRKTKAVLVDSNEDEFLSDLADLIIEDYLSKYETLKNTKCYTEIKSEA